MYLVFTGESYRWQIRSSLCLWNVFRALMISLVCWFCASALGLVLFQICNYGYKVAVLIKYRGTHLSETAIERTHSVADRHCTASTVLSLQRRSLSLTLFISTMEISRYTWCHTASETLTAVTVLWWRCGASCPRMSGWHIREKLQWRWYMPSLRPPTMKTSTCS